MKLKINKRKTVKRHIRLKPGENLYTGKNEAFKYASEAELKTKYRISLKEELNHLFI
jgi:hypothetical protein